jgi:hypothetical protein
MSATVQGPRGPMERACHAFDQMAWPCRVQPACDVQHIKYMMWRIYDAQSCEGHCQKTKVKRGIVGETDGITMAKKLDELWKDVFNDRLSPDHSVSDAVHLLDVRGNGYVRIDELLEGGQLPAVQTKAYGADFDQSVHHGEETSGLSIEGEKRDLREPSLVLPHGSSHPWRASDHTVGGTASRPSLS